MLKTVLIIAHIIVSLSLIFIVILQSGRSAGISGEISGGAETFFGKNKGRTMDAMLVRWTKIAAVIFILTSLALTVFWNN
ncbi:MAG: preprotein translocase subunit SecG [Clostridia bacterium]|nr:preprotein translocase subunit SecG [Clostridia bacterium]